MVVTEQSQANRPTTRGLLRTTYKAVRVLFEAWRMRLDELDRASGRRYGRTAA